MRGGGAIAIFHRWIGYRIVIKGGETPAAREKNTSR